MDALVFSGGIGEHSKEARKAVSGKVACLGFKGLVEAKNESVGSEEGVVVDISESGENGKRLLVCRTDEQVRLNIPPRSSWTEYMRV